ncbi:MAG: VOC family protein [Defluviicoccus sp.]|nr:VOC family protein [Defluviicoccus sp.]MDE0274513.1 VOC family protein [Defluviicoccus sp.]
MAETAITERSVGVGGPPHLDGIDHVSFPCRDLEEGIRFYRDVLGGKMLVREDAFALFEICGARFGIGSAGCTFIEPGTEYPHIGFACSADALVAMQNWLARCGIPTTNPWTRHGVEALLFFRDPSGNVIELFCHEGFEDAPNLPRGPARGHGITIDIDAISYSEWHLPEGFDQA